MKLNLFKGLAICLAIIGGAMATSSCSKEDHGQAVIRQLDPGQ